MTSRETDAAWNRTNSEGNIMTDITQAQHLKAAAQQALTVLRGCFEHPDASDAISALQHAIAQPAKPEPQITGCTEQGFMIDSASANELVAYDYAASTLCSAVLRILDGERNGFESQNEPWATVRNRLLEVMKPALQPTTHNGTGMELRDYFAAKAMQGMLANPKLEAQIIKVGQSWIEESAWAVADTMLKAR